MAELYLPRTTLELLKASKTPVEVRHPGLQLDKFSPAGKAEDQRPALEDVCAAGGDAEWFGAVIARRQRMLEALSVAAWTATTAGSLTLHLARASALENAGICLHPIYGFVYLPGSGLKGMARAFAETVWLPAQTDKPTAQDRIRAIFGWASSGDHEAAASAGTVVFHDAWPEKWPRLRLDIVNNHHPAYYQSKDGPGDWDSPNPVSFLSIGAGETFSFVLSKRTAVVSDEFVDQARAWLTGALAHLGAGAKTAAGYGTFAVPDAPPVATGQFAVEDHRLNLVTPAFLAGAKQEAEDCELRPATLRGLLRWWWRTLHAGFVDVSALRNLEACVWGDTQRGSPVRLTIEPAQATSPLVYDYRGNQDFLHKNELSPGAQKTTQGLFYASYGMGEKRRHYVYPGLSWTIRLSVRSSRYGDKNIRPEQILTQAQAALWLLCQYGGVGSKSRKGFGSFADLPLKDVSDLEGCRRVAREFRQACGLTSDRFDLARADSPAIEQVLGPIEVLTSWTNYWFALDQLGASAQDFAKRYKHDEAKMALGLPRKGVPAGPKGNRHASPVLYHLARGENGRLTVRIVAFPARLPDIESSEHFLDRLLAHLQQDVAKRREQHAGKGRAPAWNVIGRTATSVTPSAPRPALPRSGDRVEARLLADKTKRGGRKARHEPSGRSGEIQNAGDVPADKSAGETVTLIVASVSSSGIAFRWPTPADDARARKQGAGLQPKPRGGRDRGRR